MEPEPAAAAECFALGGRVRSIGRFGDGHINATYVVAAVSEDGSERRCVLQRINRAVFRDPEAVIRNVERVIAHVGSKLRDERRDPHREALRLVPTLSGSVSHRDDKGELWRCYAMIEQAAARSVLAGAGQAYTIAKAFGRFLRWLSDFPPDALETVIRGFHDTARHLRILEDAVRRAPRRREREVGDEFSFIEDRRRGVREWTDRLSSGELPTRTVHNDTKINNVLIDEETGRGICVIDLDTVMPGAAVVDIGDCARSALTRVENPGRDPEIFAAVVRGFLSEIGDLLGEAEIEQIVEATRISALELGIRFLSDFLVGDRWFPAPRPDENLDRCREQLQIVRRIEDSATEMAEVVRRMQQRGSTTADVLRSRTDEGEPTHDPHEESQPTVR